MHKEEVIISPRKARTTTVKTEQSGLEVKTPNSLHNRLPSADSGIQADGGFDSLSRYRGKNFLSFSNDQVTPDIQDSGSGKCSSGSRGRSTDQSRGSVPRSGSPEVLSLTSFMASSKPALPQKPSLTSSPSKSPHAQRSAVVISSNSLSRSVNVHSVKPSTKVKPPSPNPTARNHGTPVAITSNMSNHSESCDSSSGVSQNATPSFSKPVANQRTEPISISTSRGLGATVLPNQNVEIERVNVSPSIRVVTNDNKVNITFSKSAFGASPDVAASSDISSSSSALPSSSIPGTEEVNTASIIQTNSPGIISSISPASGANLKLQVLNPSRKSQGQQDKARNQGQGCVALTRPLKLGAPPTISIKTVQTVTPGPQPPHLVPATPPTQQEQPSSRGSTRVKPKIAPRPSVLSRAAPAQSTAGTTVIINTAPSASSAGDTSQKTELPVVHRVRLAGRTEIPVTHVVHHSPSYRSQQPHPHPRVAPPLASRPSPDRAETQTEQPVYENVLFDIREGLDFDDAEARMKHAELILRRSDQIISDAVKMLNSSPRSSLHCSNSGSGFASDMLSDGSRIVEGAESTPEKEHRVPIHDLRTGKLLAGSSKLHWPDWSSGLGGSSSEESSSEVSWIERKERMDTALSWLKHELTGLRDMDATIMSQFKRCQDTIETLKTQREVWEGLSEEGEEGEYWDDYELNEFNKRYLDSPGGSSSGQFSPGSRESSLQDVRSVSLSVPQLSLPQETRMLNPQQKLKQDIEATL